MSNSDFIFDTDQEHFDTDVVQRSHEVPVLVDFWAEWCGPCKMLMPVLAKLAKEFAGKFLLVKVDTDAQQALALQFGVRSLPTVKLFRDGVVADEFFGAQPEVAIRALLDRHLERASDQLRIEAAEARASGDFAAATKILRQAMAEDPGNERIAPELAAVLIDDGKYEEAQTIIKDLPLARQEDAEIRRLAALLMFAAIADGAPDVTALRTAVEANPRDCDALYKLGAREVLAGDHEAALEHLMEIMRCDRKFGDDAGRKGLLQVFDILGGTGPLVNRYRALMSSALY